MMTPFHRQAPLAPDVFGEDVKKNALQKTADLLRDLDKIRRAQELPPESLGLILDLYASSTRDAIAEKQHANIKDDRIPMTMTSIDGNDRPIPVKPGKITQVTERPLNYKYRVEEIEINGDPSRWLVHDIQVGHMSQFANAPRPVPGEQFRKGGIMSGLRLTACETMMDFTLIVEYIGPFSEGEVFSATIVGTAVTYWSETQAFQ